MDRRTRSIVVTTALAVLVTGAGLPPAASAQSPSASARPVVLPDLTLPADASLAADAAVVVVDAPGTIAGPIDADGAIDDALATADVLPDTAWEVGAIAETLGDDPVAAFRLVRDRIGFEPYPGVLRGAEGTLAARAGNSWDRALLLRALVEPMGIPTRFAFGELDDASARTLVARTLEPVAVPLPEAGGSAASTVELDALAARARRDYARLRASLDDAGVAVGGPSGEDLVAEVRPHAWLQVQQDGAWVDLDSSTAHAEPGQALTTATSFGDTLPDDVFQTVTLRVGVQHLADVGVLESQDVLERRLTAAEAADAEVFLYFIPETGGGGLLGGTSTGAFVPQLMVDREAEAGTAFSVAADGGGDDFFGLGGGAGPVLTGAWLTVVREAPGRDPISTTIELLDRIPEGSDRDTLSADQLEPLASTDAGPVALSGINHVLTSTGGASPRERAIARAAAVAFVSTELQDEAAASDFPLGDLLWPVAVADEQLALASERVLVPALAEAGVVAPVIDRPRVSVLSLGPDADDPKRVATSIDLAADDVRLVAAEGADPSDLAHRRMWYGALESALETETLLRSAAWGVPAGMALTGASLSMDQPLSVLTDPTALPAGAAASLAGALESGLVAVVPGDPATATTWWTVDPADGSTRAIVSPGLGGAVASAPQRRATHDVQGSWTPGGGGYVNSAQSGVRYVINPNTLEETGLIRDGQYYRYTRGAPSARTCSGGNDYSTLLGCVSIPMALVIGTVTVVITMWALSRVIRALR